MLVGSVNDLRRMIWRSPYGDHICPLEDPGLLERGRLFNERILSMARWPGRAGGSHILAYGHAPVHSIALAPDGLIYERR